MFLIDFLSAGTVPKDLIGATLVVADAPTLTGAQAFLSQLEQRFGSLALGVVGEAAYSGARPHIELPRAYGADRKRLKRLRPARLIVLGKADERFELVRGAACDTYWLNAEASAVAQTGCKLVTVSGQRQYEHLPNAEFTGDPLLALEALPGIEAGEAVCERFKEFRDRDYPVFYVAATGEDEEAWGYGMLFEILRKKTALMVLAPADTERHERVYHDAIKYHLPTIRHSRLYTSFIPKKNRVYYVEEPEALSPLYACANFVVAGGTLHQNAVNTPDLLTPLRLGKPVLVGPRRDNAMVNAAIQAEVVIAADDVDALSEQALRLLADPGEAKAMAERASAWLERQVGATARVLSLLG